MRQRTKENIMFTAVGALAAMYFGAPWAVSAATKGYAQFNQTVPTPDRYFGVVAVGSSSAAGYGDEPGKGYLTRAFDLLSQYKHANYQFVNDSWSGHGPTQDKKVFQLALQQVKPSMVVIAYGLLNDLHRHTPLPAFKQALHNEISEALSRNAVVVLTTPPATKATYTEFKDTEPLYIDAEIEVARSFNNPNVYVFNLTQQMEDYLAKHHQTWAPYNLDGWHLNPAGHKLAAELLAQDMNAAFQKKSWWSFLKRWGAGIW